MSRLNDLIEQAKASNPELGNALAEEVQRLEDRPTFGLVFERHAPETTELYGRPIAPGDKVHVLNERGSTANADQTLWRVQDIHDSDTSGPEAHLLETLPGNQEWDVHAIGREPQKETALVENLVVVAEHTDTIYPGLVETGRVDKGSEDAPAHTIINAENLHALQALTYTHRHSIDCIYIDPPYNTGARDWKYNNHYVEADDDYRHSKWLSFMEKRLLLAKELLNPADSVLIVTIDEKEYLRLGLLLQQVFPEGRMEMITSVISAKGVIRAGQFSRVQEYIFVVQFGSSRVKPWVTDFLNGEVPRTGQIPTGVKKKLEWLGLRRREPTAVRGARKNQFYPIFLDPESGFIRAIGEAVPDDVDVNEVPAYPRLLTVWPVRGDGRFGIWGLTPEVARENWRAGYIRANYSPRSKKATIYYLPTGTIKKVQSESFVDQGRSADGSINGYFKPETPSEVPRQVWAMSSHNAEAGGTILNSKLLPGRRFPFPKSLYAVEDVVRFFVKDKPNAAVLDFFAGSGTTAHAVMRLNKQDGGKRRSIMVTNNEVSAEEQKTLREKGFRPGDPEWEALGIADYVTKPRVTAAITGKTPEGDPIKGDYKFTDEFPMSDGFEANARYFSLEYLNPVMVEFGYAFSRIAPLLWMRAGQVGPVIDELPDRGWEVTDFYAVIENCDDAPAFIEAVKQRPGITHVYIITDNVSVYRRVARGFDDSIQAIQLYESYLTNFAINASRVLK